MRGRKKGKEKERKRKSKKISSVARFERKKESGERGRKGESLGIACSVIDLFDSRLEKVVGRYEGKGKERKGGRERQRGIVRITKNYS